MRDLVRLQQVRDVFIVLLEKLDFESADILYVTNTTFFQGYITFVSSRTRTLHEEEAVGGLKFLIPGSSLIEYSVVNPHMIVPMVHLVEKNCSMRFRLVGRTSYRIPKGFKLTVLLG
jgi:hypothetical protein